MDKNLRFTQGLGVAALLLASSCSPGPEGMSQTTGDEPTAQSKDPEAIDSVNDPNRFQLDMRRGIDQLPANGESTRKPFPSNWWPMSRAGIAQKWNGGQASPAEKYDQLTAPDQIRDVELTLAKKNYKDEPVNQDARPETFGRKAVRATTAIREPEGLLKMVRTGGWKYVYDPADPIDQLYDLARDPWETDNLAGDPGHAEIVARMQRLLLDWHVQNDRLAPFRAGALR